MPLYPLALACVFHHLMGARKLRNLKVAATKSLNLGYINIKCTVTIVMKANRQNTLKPLTFLRIFPVTGCVSPFLQMKRRITIQPIENVPMANNPSITGASGTIPFPIKQYMQW